MASRGPSRRTGARATRPAATRPLGAARRTSESTKNSGPGRGATSSVAGLRARIAQARSKPWAVRGAIILTIVVLLGAFLTSTVANWMQQRTDIEAMRTQVAAQEKTVADLQREQARWQDPAYVEQQARQRLKFVKPGEKSYTVIDAAPGRDPVLAGVAGADAEKAGPWYGAVWDSIRVADVPNSR
jgi:cell division protein FtsB